MKRILALIGWLAATPALVAAGVEFEARLWAPDLSGGARVNGGATGTTIDLASDLGFGQDEGLEGRLTWRPTRRTSLRLSYDSFDFTGDARLDRTVSFAGTDFELDARVASALELEYAGLGFGWQFVSFAAGRARLGPLVEVRGLRGRAALSTDILGLLPLSASEEFELAFAAAGLILDVEPTRKFHAYARWTTSAGADEGTLTDAAAGLRFYPLDTLALTVGYRRLEIQAADRGEAFDLDLDGPFFGGLLRF